MYHSPSSSRLNSARQEFEGDSTAYLQKSILREDLPKSRNASNESLNGFHKNHGFTKSSSFGSLPQLVNPPKPPPTDAAFSISKGTGNRTLSASKSKLGGQGSTVSFKDMDTNRDGLVAGLEVTGSRPTSSSTYHLKKSRSNLTDALSRTSLNKSSTRLTSESTYGAPSQRKKSITKEEPRRKSFRKSIDSGRGSGDLRDRVKKEKGSSSDLLSASRQQSIAKPHRLASLGNLSSIARSSSKNLAQLASLSLTDSKTSSTTQRPKQAIQKEVELEDDEDTYTHIGHSPQTYVSGSKYLLTPYQQEVYNVICPTREEREVPSYVPYRGPAFVACHAYRCQHYFDASLLSKVINKLLCTYRVLKTRFYRNDRIIDADTEGVLDAQPWHQIQPMSYLEVIDPFHPTLSGKIDDLKSLSSFVRQWNQNIGVTRPFSVLLVRSLFGDSERKDDNLLILTGSLLVTDDTSLTFIAKDIVLLYKDCERLQHLGRSEAELDSVIESYKPMETESFADYAFDCKRTKLDVAFWKDQCIEVSQESVDDFEKRDLESQLKRIDKEKNNLQTTVSSLSKRRNELETELQSLRLQRKQIGRGENGEGITSTFVDAATGEVIHITQEAKEALIRTVLGEEAASDNVVRLLDKHEVPPEVQRKLQASVLSIEAFANLSEEQVEPLGLLTKDKRQILALSEYVRNRIKDCIQEQTKVKFALERRIAKIARELETSTDNLRSSQNLLESNDDLSMRLRGILKPPLVETKIQPLSLDQLADRPKTTSFSVDGFADVYDYVPIEIEETTLENLRRFRNSWSIAKRKKAGEGNISSDNESLLASDGSDHEAPIEEEQDGAKLPGSNSRKLSLNADGLKGGEHRKNKTKSIDLVCLSAFAVLLKHISGSEKFLIGVTQSYRRNGAYVGPLTDTVPVKIDLSKRGTTFEGLFGQLMKSLKHIKRYGAGCPLAFISRNNDLPTNLDIRFEFHTLNDTREWTRRGLYPEDLLQANQPTFFQKEGFSTERLWCANEQDAYDIKLVLVETQDGLQGGIRYRKSRFQSEKALKWAVKMGALFESIDYNPRKIKISSMISRFYNDVWQGSNSNLINGSSMSIYSSRASIASQ